VGGVSSPPSLVSLSPPPPLFTNTAVSTHTSRAHTTSCIASLSPHEQWLVTVVMGTFTVGCGGLQSPHPIRPLSSFIICHRSLSSSLSAVIPVCHCCHAQLCLCTPPIHPASSRLPELEVGALSLVPALTWQVQRPSSVVCCPSTIPVVPSTSHPMSSGLWAWGQVVGCLALQCCLGGHYNMK
jgi:hypothetical protein